MTFTAPSPPIQRSPHPLRTRGVRGILLAVVFSLTSVLVGAGALVWAPPAGAASQGTGFGTWAPLSAYGWHGSMLVDGVHTYCILPGLPAPTGSSTDHGVRSDAGGLSPQQLTGINLLVTTYGQTSDPVQAAAVGWAVKAIANRHTTLHSWGYPGDSLAGAVHWIFDRLAPGQAASVADLAERYYAEGAAAVVPGRDATLTLTTDALDPRRGIVRRDGGAGTTATISLVNAVFAGSGAATLTDAPAGVDLPIVAVPPADARPFTVAASARFVATVAPAVRYVTTPGQQDTAGPGGGFEHSVSAQDAAPRPVVFSPGITTQVAAAEVDGGAFVDDVHVSAVTGSWPRTAEGAFVALRATATVYRTEDMPAPSDVVPAEATAAGELDLTTDPRTGEGTYRVTSDWELPGPGVYTAVWRISAADQAADVAPHLERGFLWVEEFATPSQITRVPVPPVTPPPAEAPPPSPAPSATPTPHPTPTPALAETGGSTEALRIAGFATASLVLGAALVGHALQRRRRVGEHPGIGETPDR